MKKTLFIISLRYPLINAINIKLNELHDKQADIILDDTIRNDSYQLAENLRKSQIFDNVFFTNPDGYNGLKKFFQNFNITNSFIKACYGSYKNLKLRYLFKTNPEAYLNNIVISGGTIDLSLYDDIYVCSQTRVSKICLKHLTNINHISKINLIEEGINTYYNYKEIYYYSTMYSNQKIIIHLYEPNLVGYNMNLKNVSFSSIKKFSYNNSIFRNKLNKIFDYNCKQNFNDKIIFFEQVSEPMPNYLSNKIFKFILFNAHKKHLKEHNLFLDKITVITNLISFLKSYNLLNAFYIKLHPRTKKGITPNMLPYIIGDINNYHSIPWEIYCLNQSFDNNLWITINSSSVLNKMLCFEKNNNVKFIFLYKCTKYFGKKNKELEQFYDNFIKKYHDCILIPNTLTDIVKIFPKKYLFKQ